MTVRTRFRGGTANAQSVSVTRKIILVLAAVLVPGGFVALVAAWLFRTSIWRAAASPRGWRDGARRSRSGRPRKKEIRFRWELRFRALRADLDPDRQRLALHLSHGRERPFAAAREMERNPRIADPQA
ncbi:MAG: hypothetical protein E6J88_08360, partial [Deltaproteobacteria bacterium]